MVSEQPETQQSAPTTTKRVVKRYSNRKLYDTQASSYVTLLQIAEMVRAGDEVQVIDNATKEDKTDVTLALIIAEELKSKPHAIPLATLKTLIRHRGEKLLSQIKDGPIGRLMPGDAVSAAVSDPPMVPVQGLEDEGQPMASEPPAEPETARQQENQVTSAKDQQGRGLRATLEQWQAAVDERIRAVVPNFLAFRELQAEIRQLSDRVQSLENRLSSQDAPKDQAPDPSISE